MYSIILLFFTLIPDVKSDSLRSSDCNAMEITYSATESNRKTRIELKVKGGSGPYIYIFFDEKNNPLSWDFQKSIYIVDGTGYPKYAKVRDAEGCLKRIEFNESANK